MAVVPDGRLFGFCGTEMANLFCCDTVSGQVANLTSSATPSPGPMVKSFSARRITAAISGSISRRSPRQRTLDAIGLEWLFAIFLRMAVL